MAATCEPAYSIVIRLGGDLAVARRVGVYKKSVWKWHAPKRQGGTGGKIPRKRWPALLAMAADLGIPLSERELAGQRSV
jgi:hypothetical protein